MKRVMVSWVSGFMLAASAAAGPPSAPHEQVEWTWAEFPDKIDPSLPDVLLEGDSISRNYYHDVEKRLDGKANVFLFATSACVGDPALEGQLRAYSALARRRFKVVHFNNGMHGWKRSEAQYRDGFTAYLGALRVLAPRAKLIWATTTHVRAPKDGASDSRIDARNMIARHFVDSAGIRTDDQSRLMQDKMDLYQDDVHFGPQGSTVQAEAVVRSVLAEL